MSICRGGGHLVLKNWRCQDNMQTEQIQFCTCTAHYTTEINSSHASAINCLSLTKRLIVHSVVPLPPHLSGLHTYTLVSLCIYVCTCVFTSDDQEVFNAGIYHLLLHHLPFSLSLPLFIPMSLLARCRPSLLFPKPHLARACACTRACVRACSDVYVCGWVVTILLCDHASV